MSFETDEDKVMFLDTLLRREVEAGWQDKKSARALLFATDCNHVLPITVLQKQHVTSLESVDDLNLTRWLSNPLSMESDVRADCLDDRMLKVDRFPFDSKYPMSVAYTIFWGPKHRVNFTMAKLSKQKIHWGAGNIVVVKHKAGPFIYPLDLEEADLSLVVAIVLSAIEVGKISDLTGY